MDPTETDSEYTTDSDYEDYEDYEDSDSENEEREEIEKFTNMINSPYRPVQFEGLLSIRRILSLGDDSLIEKVIDAGILPKILEIMTWENESHFQIESAWCVVNISAGATKFSDCLIELGGLDIIINLLDSPLSDIAEQAVWTISNIAGDSFEHRDICLQKDCLNKILRTYEKFPTSHSFIEITLIGIANLSRGKPFPEKEQVLPALTLLYKHISEVHSQEALRNALWSIAYIGGIFFQFSALKDKNIDKSIQEVIDQGCVPFLIQHFCDARLEIFSPALRALSNVMYGNEKQANEVLRYPEFLSRLFDMTTHPKTILRKEAFLTISNIAAGTSEHIDMIITNDNYIHRLKNAVETESPEVAREAAWTITNIVSEATAKQMHQIISQQRLLESLTYIIRELDDDLKKNVLDAILNVLKTETDSIERDFQIKEIKEAGLIEIIRDLAKDSEFSSNAGLIMKSFSVENPEEYDNETENVNKKGNNNEK